MIERQRELGGASMRILYFTVGIRWDEWLLALQASEESFCRARFDYFFDSSWSLRSAGFCLPVFQRVLNYPLSKLWKYGRMFRAYYFVRQSAPPLPQLYLPYLWTAIGSFFPLDWFSVVQCRLWTRIRFHTRVVTFGACTFLNEVCTFLNEVLMPLVCFFTVI